MDTEERCGLALALVVMGGLLYFLYTFRFPI